MNVKSSGTPSALLPIQRTTTWMVENFKRFLNGFIILLHSIHVRSRYKTLSKAKLLTSDKQSTRIVPPQVKTQWSSHWKEMAQNWMMWKVDSRVPRFACKQNLSGKRRESFAIPLSQLATTVLRERGTFLSNRCKIEKHNAYQTSRRQVTSVVSPSHEFPEKHICRKMFNSALFCLWRRTGQIQWITLPSFASLILCWKV